MTLAGKLSIGTLVVALSATSVFAKGGGRFEQIDANGDGFITEAEFAAAKSDRFSNGDTNGDGGLSAEEMAIAAQKRINREVSAERLAEWTNRMVERHDANGDGLLQATEVPGPSFAQMLEKADANGDGQLSQEEMASLREHRGFGRKG